MFDVAVSSNTAFTASYSTITDSVSVIYDADFVDYAVINKSNTNYMNTSNHATITVDEDGKTFSNTASSQRNVYAIANGVTPSASNIKWYSGEKTIEFDVIGFTSNSAFTISDDTGTFQIRFNQIGLTSGTLAHLRIELRNGSQKVYVNDSSTSAYDTSYTLSDFYFRFRLPVRTSVKIRNLVIY